MVLGVFIDFLVDFMWFGGFSWIITRLSRMEELFVRLVWF